MQSVKLSALSSIERQSVSDGVLPMKDTLWVKVHVSLHRLRSHHSSTSAKIHIDSYICLARNTGRTSAGVKQDGSLSSRQFHHLVKIKRGVFTSDTVLPLVGH